MADQEKSPFAEIPYKLSISEHNTMIEALDKCIMYGGKRPRFEYEALRRKFNNRLLDHMKGSKA